MTDLFNPIPFKNIEGYSDPTAFTAINRVRENMIKDVKNDVSVGDVVRLKKTGKIVLVLSKSDKFALTTKMTDECYDGNLHVVYQGGDYYINTYMMSYCFYDVFDEISGKMDDSEMQKVREDIADKLYINTSETADRKVKESERKVDELIATLTSERASHRAEMDALKSKINAHGNSADTVRLEAERDVYKRMYDDLIARIAK